MSVDRDMAVVDEGFVSLPAVFLKCACPCGCKKETKVPAVGGSIALARHARCLECGEESHMSAHPTPAPVDAPGRKSITELYVPSSEEVERAREVQLEVFGEIWTEQWNRWQASLPEKFRHAESAHVQVQERLRRLAVGENGVASLVILGAPGFGKTWLAVAYANAAIKAGYFKPSEVLFGTEAELLASVANSGFGEVESGLRRLISPKIRMLIIDDVGRGTWLNEAMRPKVFSLVMDKFWSENRVIVVTSNLAPNALGEYIGDGAMDRLRSMVGSGALVLDTESKRKKVTEEMLARAKQAPESIAPPVPPLS